MKEQNSRETILNCALQLFSAKGYDAVGVGEIVERASITKPTLYYYFGSKEGLFDELLKENYAKLDRMLAGAVHYTPSTEYHKDIYPVLMRIARVYFAFAQSDTAFYRVMMSLAFAPPYSRPAQMAEAYHRQQYARVEAAFRAISARHTGLRGRERVFAWRFVALLTSQIAFWQRGYAQLTEAEAHYIVNSFMHGIFA